MKRWAMAVAATVSMVVSAEPAFTNVRADSLWIQVEPSKLAAARAALPGWTFEPLVAGTGEYVVSPPNAETLPVSVAFSLAHQLKTEQRVVVDVDPFLVAGSADEPLVDAGAVVPAWHLERMRVPQAWKLLDGGTAAVAAIVIAHPDSGKKGTTEEPPVRGQRDFIGEDDDATDPDPKDGHGLATSSIFGSPDDSTAAPNSVTGVAPGVGWIPLRVSKRNGPFPSPILFDAGTKRLTRAINRAVDEKADVISISLGWFGNEALHRAIQRAVDANIIVIAAAGNVVQLTVWPARYDETIAMAASGPDDKPWWGSSHGDPVDFMAPGHQVVVAGADGPRVSSGTSFATANVAGVAALWLAHHGKQKLLAKYPNQRLSEVFRAVLTASVRKQPAVPRGYGAGHVDAAKCLSVPLPPSTPTAPLAPATRIKKGLELQNTKNARWKQVFALPEPLFARELAVMEVLEEEPPTGAPPFKDASGGIRAMKRAEMEVLVKQKMSPQLLLRLEQP